MQYASINPGEFLFPFLPVYSFLFSFFLSLHVPHIHTHYKYTPLEPSSTNIYTRSKNIHIKRVRYPARKAFFGLEKKVWIVERLTKTSASFVKHMCVFAAFCSGVFDFRKTRLRKKRKERLFFFDEIQAKNAPLILKAGRGEIRSHLE